MSIPSKSALAILSRDREGAVLKIRCAILVALVASQLFSQPLPTPVGGGEGAKAGQQQVNPKDDLVYVWIPPGRFRIGCSPSDTECDNNEKPVHEVSLSKGFWMGQTLVTQVAYQRVTGRTLSYFSGSKFPADSVTWDEAQSYCQVTGMRLPTEAEWEYAARARNTANRYGVIDEIAWYGVNSAEHTHDVMQKQSNAWGLYDMLGDVWEWTADWLAPYGDIGDGGSVDPQGPTAGKLRVLRGGSWANGPAFVRISARSGNEPDHRSNVVGFRCVGN